MRFQISRNSRYPIHEQIKEQIRLALSLGQIGPGYALPSIRDLEKELGVGRGIVHRVYRELERSGILTLQPRKGVVVSYDIFLPKSNHRARACQALMEKVFQEVKKLGIPESSFAALFYQRAVVREQAHPPIAYVESIKTEALQCAGQVSREWGTTVTAISLDEFKNLKRADISFNWVLTPFYEYELVARLAKKLKVEVAPVVLKFSSDFIAELKTLLKDGKALIILADSDFERHGEQLIEELRGGIGADRSRNLFALPLSEIRSIEAVARSGKYKRVYVGNRIWDSLEDRIKKLPKIGHPGVEIDGNSLQQAKVKLGLLV